MHLIRCTTREQRVGIIKNNVKIGALIVYDITDHESWLKVTSWMKELQMYLPPDTPIVITGNKADLPNR